MERFGGVAELAPNLRIAGSVRPEGCGLALGLWDAGSYYRWLMSKYGFVYCTLLYECLSTAVRRDCTRRSLGDSGSSRKAATFICSGHALHRSVAWQNPKLYRSRATCSISLQLHISGWHALARDRYYLFKLNKLISLSLFISEGLIGSSSE